MGGRSSARFSSYNKPELKCLLCLISRASIQPGYKPFFLRNRGRPKAFQPWFLYISAVEYPQFALYNWVS